MSSRSHSLFTIMLQRRAHASADVVTSKFHLVDLAGSERNKKTGTAGHRFKESVTINQVRVERPNTAPRRRAFPPRPPLAAAARRRPPASHR
eukprot:3155872-Prymnesium_polylepis.1